MMETYTAMMWLQVIKDKIWVYFCVCVLSFSLQHFDSSSLDLVLMNFY